MIKEKIFKQFLAAILIAALFGVLLYGAWPYLNALLGAFILFIIFLPLYRLLTRRLKIKAGLAAILIILLSIVLILIPLSFLASVLVKEIQIVLADVNARLGGWGTISQWLPQLNIAEVGQQIAQAGSTASRVLFGTLSAIGNQVVSYLIMFFLFYFLLTTDEDKLSRTVFAIMPFSRDNTLKLQRQFRTVTYATLITSGLIAVVQGVLMGLSFWWLGLAAPVLWGSVATITSFIPVIGAGGVWVPAVIILLIQGNLWAGVGILICGLIISSVDNFLRPAIQKKVGAIHPFVSLLGVFIGLSLFGLVGLIIGPLLISYFLLMAGMFKEEYID
jgi:predicted PurR-regulated permease PerM